jgi:t-SNARE complex subunit (syntaxin)
MDSRAVIAVTASGEPSHFINQIGLQANKIVLNQLSFLLSICFHTMLQNFSHQPARLQFTLRATIPSAGTPHECPHHP